MPDVLLNTDHVVVFGTDGPDAGGYCCPVAVASIDIWKLGQIRPGDSVQLVPRRLSDVLAEVERRTNALKTCMSSVTPLDVAQLYGPNDLDREVERSRLVEGSIVQRKHNKFIHGDVSYRQVSPLILRNADIIVLRSSLTCRARASVIHVPSASPCRGVGAADQAGPGARYVERGRSIADARCHHGAARSRIYRRQVRSLHRVSE